MKLNYPIEEFQIRYDYGHTVVYPIEDLWVVDELIRDSGRGSIAKVSFYFTHPQYSFYNLILYNRGDYFQVKFAADNLTDAEKLHDFAKVIDAINSCRNLDARLGHYVRDPFAE